MADTLTDADIDKASATLTDADIDKQHQQTSGLLDAVGRFGQGFYDKTLKGAVDLAGTAAHAIANPRETVSAIANSPEVQHPVDTAVQAAKDAYNSHAALLQKAKDSLSQGDYQGAVDHATNALVPILGPSVDASMDKVKGGDVAGGMGELVGNLATVLSAAPGVSGLVASKAGDLADVVKAAMSAGGKDIAVGATKTAGGIALPIVAAHIPGGPAIQTGAEIAGVGSGLKLAKQGVQQMATGGRAALKAARQALTDKIMAAMPAAEAVPMEGATAVPPGPLGQGDNPLPSGPEPRPRPQRGSVMIPNSSGAAASAGPELAGPQSMSVRPVPPGPLGQGDTALPSGPQPVPRPQRGPIMAPGSSGLQAVPGALPKPTTIPFSESETPSVVFEAQARAEKAQKLAQFLHDGGITADEAKAMTGDHWQMAAKGAGVNAPSLSSQGQAMFELRRLEAASHSPQLIDRLKNSGALPAAQQLQQLMGQ